MNIIINNYSKKIILFAIACIAPLVLNAQQYYTGDHWGDNGDGTFNNPVLPGDFRDPDVIRVGKDYYMITSTFWMSPGITILHSNDLVNWEYSGAAVSDISTISEKYTWAYMRYYGGVWAPCISYNKKNKTYYIHWGDNVLGFFVVTSKSMKGPWSLPHKVLLNGKPLGPDIDDCGVMWDDNGTGYFVYNEYGKDLGYRNYLHKLAPDGYTLLDKGIKIHENHDSYGMGQTGSEAYKLFKHGGYYYLWHNEVPANGQRQLCMMRSTCIYGRHTDGSKGTFKNPGKYEHGNYFIWGYRQPSQGNIIDTPDGKNWFLLTHLDKPEIEGAPICVVPMKWENGWIVPAIAANGTGASMDDERMWKNLEKPVQGHKRMLPAMSDDFSASSIGKQWLWNHQPRADYWSLTERPGFLRLYAWNTLNDHPSIDQINLAGNTIYQRYFRNKSNEITIKIDVSSMVDGQNAGMLFANYQRYFAAGICQDGDEKFVRYYESTPVGNNANKYLAVKGCCLPNNIHIVYIRNISDFNGNSEFLYSTDGKNFIKFGERYQLVTSGHRGFNVGIFNYNNKSAKGWIDVDEFEYRMSN